MNHPELFEASAPAIVRRNLMEDHARDRLGQPEDWHLFRMECQPIRPKSTHMLLTGAVCTAMITRGPRKGERNWTLRDRTTECSVSISFEDHERWLRAWEAKHGVCATCQGTRLEFAGWGVSSGVRYRPCTDCGATGKPKAAAP